MVDLTVKDIMRPRSKTPIVKGNAKIKDVLLKITKLINVFEIEQDIDTAINNF